MQVEITIEVVKDLPGAALQSYFQSCEFVSFIKWENSILHCYVKLEYEDEKSLQVDHQSLSIVEIIITKFY